jgi:hypothetical protein
MAKIAEIAGFAIVGSAITVGLIGWIAIRVVQHVAKATADSVSSLAKELLAPPPDDTHPVEAAVRQITQAAERMFDQEEDTEEDAPLPWELGPDGKRATPVTVPSDE